MNYLNKYEKFIESIGSPLLNLNDNIDKHLIGPALNINMSGYHDALVDCRLMIQMFSKMIAFLKEHQNVDITKYQMERIRTIK